MSDEEGDIISGDEKEVNLNYIFNFKIVVFILFPIRNYH